jgi:hypothetical protein
VSENENPPIEYFLHLSGDGEISHTLQVQLLDMDASVVIAMEMVPGHEKDAEDHMHCVVSSRTFSPEFDDSEHTEKLAALLRAVADILESGRFEPVQVAFEPLETGPFIVDAVDGLP